MWETLAKLFPDVKLVRPLMPGGQKEVFLVDSPRYGRCVLKAIRAAKTDRVEREIKIITENNIPNVPKMFETGTFQYKEETCLYIFEQFISGESLAVRLKRGALSFKEGVALLETLLAIAKELELISVVHRDIKPDNILVDENGQFYLIDFGIARALNMSSLTLTNVAVGPHTPGYGAPELFQYSKYEITARADLFSIGVVVYEAVVGTHPFLDGSEDELSQIWYKTVSRLPEAITIPGDTQQLFMGLLSTLMQKQISKRPSTAEKAYSWLIAAKDTFVFGDE